MSTSITERRTLLKVLLALPLAVPAGYAVHSLWSRTHERTRGASEAPRTLEAALERLLFVVGPWPPSERQKAREHAGLLISPQEVARHRPHAALVIGLASRFRPDEMAVKEINLAALSAPERRFLVSFAEDVYRSDRILGTLTRELPEGVCIGDPTWHTRTI